MRPLRSPVSDCARMLRTHVFHSVPTPLTCFRPRTHAAHARFLNAPTLLTPADKPRTHAAHARFLNAPTPLTCYRPRTHAAHARLLNAPTLHTSFRLHPSRRPCKRWDGIPRLYSRSRSLPPWTVSFWEGNRTCTLSLFFS